MEISDTAKMIRPFWGRVALLPSPVDEYERASGLVVPDHYDGSHESGHVGIYRGIVIAIDPNTEAIPGFPSAEWLPVGTVCWYTSGGYTVRDTVIIAPEDIIAIEVDPDPRFT